MIHLHQLYERYVVPDPIAGLQPALEKELEAAKRAMCFDIGELSALADMCKGKAVAVPPMPFDCCWFEFADEGALTGLLVRRWAGGLLMAVGFMRVQGQDWRVFAAMRVVEGSSVCEFCDTADAAYSKAAFLKLDLAWNAVGTFLAILACNNVAKVKTAADVRLNAKRVKSGRVPLFSYWTLVLRGKNDQGEYMGGTHASPRVHLRRGHIREYAPGKTTWVQASVVGNKSLGMVHKDYRFEPQRVGA